MPDQASDVEGNDSANERRDRTVTPGRRPKYLVNHDFARLWYGQAISTVGDFVFDTTLTLWIATDLLSGSRWAPVAVSGLLLCAFGATMVIGPLAGVFVDRWSRRRTMLRSEILRAVVVGVLAVIMLLPPKTIPTVVWLMLIYLVVIAVNSAEQFFNPSRFATIADIVPGEADRAKAFGISQATVAGAAIIGPPLAAPLLFALGVQWAIFINAASYVVSFIVIRSVSFPASDRNRDQESPGSSGKLAWHKEFLAGIKIFAKNHYLVAMVTIAVIASLGSGAINALLVFFVSANLHVTSHLLGVMWMAYGAGAVVGGLVSGRLVKLLYARNVTWLCLVLSGLIFFVLSRQTALAAAIVLMFAMAVPVAAMNAAIGPQLMAVTPKEFIGRMIAVLNPVMTGASMISVVVSGLLASTVMRNFHIDLAGLHLGRIDTIFSVAAILIFAAGVYAYFSLPPVERPTALPEDIAHTVTTAAE